LREESSINSRGQKICREEGRVAPKGGRSRDPREQARDRQAAAASQDEADESDTRQRRKRQERERREWDDREVA